jgi:poly-gamma-glutamate capsule biosynthesis protein CapA/YwtB (metallophosphatase superfamily)
MNFAFIGDIAFNGIICQHSKENSDRYSKISGVLKNPNLVFANLETPIKVDDCINNFKSQVHYSTYEASKQLLNFLNIGCVSLANNHIYDCRMAGLKATISLLDELNIKHTGAGYLPVHVEPAIIQNESLKIAFLAYIDISTNPKTENFPELLINYFELHKVKRDIQMIKNTVDKIIVSVHWGNDYSYYPTPLQVSLAHEIADTGADIIMGHHPHTFQPFEKYKNTFIFYSLGGLTFGDYMRNGKTELQALFRKTKKSAIANYYLEENRLEFIPTHELKGNYIIIAKRDYFKWSAKKWIHFRIKYSSRILEKIYSFNENVLYRVYEYFFGYYKNPFYRLLQFSNFKKLKKLF